MSQGDSQSNPTLTAGMQLGAYRIERLIGSGGMSEVFYAVHEGLQRPAAIKVLRESLAADEVNLKRFMQEARAAASLVHPNIVQVYDVGKEGQLRYIAQEYVAGVNLRQYLSQPEDSPGSETQSAIAVRDQDDTFPALSHDDKQIGVTETLSILLQVLAALGKSSASGIVHRDIKPENIMLTHEGEVKVADFGLARSLLGEDPKLTRVGTTLGTPMYMSPEQIQDGNVDIRSDLYSLGVTLYHMLSGRPPFEGDTPLALAMQHVQAEVPGLRTIRSELPDSLVALIDRLLLKKPEERFRSPDEVLAYLQTHRSGDLKDYWPERTVPLPGVETSLTQGVVQATLELQSRLADHSWKRQVIFRGLALVACLAVGLVGLVRNFATPKLLDPDELPEVFAGVPKLPNAQEQYNFALVTEDSGFTRVDKWRAVGHYHPKEEKELNKTWIGMASIQESRALRRKGEYDEARRVLRRTTEDEDMLQLHRAWAWIELAVLEDELGDEGDMNQLKQGIERARELFRSMESESDKELLKNLIRDIPGAVSREWFNEEANAEIEPLLSVGSLKVQGFSADPV